MPGLFPALTPAATCPGTNVAPNRGRFLGRSGRDFSAQSGLSAAFTSAEPHRGLSQDDPSTRLRRGEPRQEIADPPPPSAPHAVANRPCRNVRVVWAGLGMAAYAAFLVQTREPISAEVAGRLRDNAAAGNESRNANACLYRRPFLAAVSHELRHSRSMPSSDFRTFSRMNISARSAMTASANMSA